MMKDKILCVYRYPSVLFLLLLLSDMTPPCVNVKNDFIGGQIVNEVVGIIYPNGPSDHEESVFP